MVKKLNIKRYSHTQYRNTYFINLSNMTTPTASVFSRKELMEYVDKTNKNIEAEFNPTITYTHTPARNVLCIVCGFDGFAFQIYVNLLEKRITDYRIKINSTILNIFKVIFNDGNFSQAEATVKEDYFDGIFQELIEWRTTYERIMRETEIKKYIKADDLVSLKSAPSTKIISTIPTTASTLVKHTGLSPYEIKSHGDSDAPFTLDSVVSTLDGFIKFIMIIRAYQFNTFIRSVRENKINYNQLSLLYKIKSKYLFPHQGIYEVGVLISKALSPFGIWTFVYQYTKYDAPNKKFITVTRSYLYSNYLQILDIDTVPIKPYSDTLYEEYHRRGLLYIETVPHIRHVHCNGMFYDTVTFNSSYLNGRVIVDEGYINNTPPVINPWEKVINSWGDEDNDPSANKVDISGVGYNLADHEIDICTPFVLCYSLDLEKWGEIMVTDLVPIKYRDDAFEMLCLDTPIKISSEETMRKKDLIHKMVTNFKSVDRSDFIDGKTGGLIIALYGPPGVGKTFTAEATAETLHQPLCKISAGSLGTTPETVEKSLREFFANVKRWNGIALIDEVDIFLEKRSSNTDITKNAIVGVFLKTIEYCDTIVFMTSNRIECIDPAMKSRMDLELEYDELSIEDKVKIYINKMKRTESVEPYENIHKFMVNHHHLNGRNLKSVIKTAQYIAYPRQPTIDHISAIAELTQKVKID